MNGKKEMGQELVRNNEFSELYIILKTYNDKREKIKIEESQKQYELYELYENLNPRYSEAIIPPKEAKERIASSDIIYSSKYNIFSNY